MKNPHVQTCLNMKFSFTHNFIHPSRRLYSLNYIKTNVLQASSCIQAEICVYKNGLEDEVLGLTGFLSLFSVVYEFNENKMNNWIMMMKI